MSNKPPAMHLKVAIQNKIYVLGTLSYNLSKNEVSLYFHCPDFITDNVLNLDTGKTIDPIDHITWHEKVMQIRTRKKILQQIKYPQGSLFPKQKSVVSMYVECIYLNSENSMLLEDKDLKWKTNSDEVLILDQKEPSNFSIIFLLAPDDWKTSDIIIGSRIEGEEYGEIPLFYLRSTSHEIGRIKCFEGWDMLIFTAPYVRTLPPLDSRLGNTYRASDFVAPVNSLTSLLAQAKKLSN